MLVTQRSASMDLPFQWEFPGGKIDPGESETDCIKREIREELQLEIEPLKQLPITTYNYGTKVIRLIPFICRYRGGVIQLLEHRQYRWMAPEDLPQLNWCAADLLIVDAYLEQIRYSPCAER